MRKYLTIGELADIMNISASSIRFYEKEGLLTPYMIDENGYRLYDFNEMDRLETILLLRKMDVPLKQLRTIINSSSITDYMETLKSSLTSIDSKIRQLNSKRQYIVKKIKYVENFMKDRNTFNVIHVPERVLYCIHTGRLFDYTIKDTYEIIKSQDLDYIDMYQDNYIISLGNDIYSFCILESPEMEASNNFEKVILPEGFYLDYDFFVNDYDMIDIEKDKFFDYMKNNKFTPIGNLIAVEKTKTSDFYLRKLNLNLQILIKAPVE